MADAVAPLPSSLDMELYEVREAARLLKLRTFTLRRWLEGANISGTFYEPLLRPEPTGSSLVTWGEFVDAGFLREYRQVKDIPMQRMRPFIADLRRATGVRYPLAEFKPLVDSSAREAVLEAQNESGFTEDEFILRRVGPLAHEGAWQVSWAEPVRQFLEKVEFDDEAIARRFFPLGKERRVAIDPNVVFGIPQIGGIRTEILVESFAELGDEAQVAEEWGITAEDVAAALQWEVSLRRAA